MRRDWREAEILLLTMYSAIPMYASESGLRLTVVVCHTVLGLLLAMALSGRALRVPRTFLHATGVLYLLFLPFDAAVLSRSLITASTNLVFFISVYQALDPETRHKRGQRLLIALLICVTSLATSTSLMIVLFLLGFAVMVFRQLIDLTHEAALLDVDEGAATVPPRRAAWTYLAPTALVAGLLFPMLPRIHNPLVRGMTGNLGESTTGLSESIDFTTERSITQDPSVVARVWMPADAIPFFTPLRLRGNVYDTWKGGRWAGNGRNRDYRSVPGGDGVYVIAKPVGFSRRVRVQQNLGRDRRLLVPEGTHLIHGVPQLLEVAKRTTYVVPPGPGSITYEAELSRRVLPLEKRELPSLDYPISPEVQLLAERLSGTATTPRDIASVFERYLVGNFAYVPNPADLGRTFSVDEFLLRERRGHCEYFAAGMVVLLKAKNVQSRIVGGFYGGKLNPLTGYFTVQRSDAHAWVEVWDGETWETFDPTPPGLRPGNQKQGLVRAYASALADSVSYFWDRYVLTFGLGDQLALITRLVTDAGSMLRNSRAGAADAIKALFSLRGLMVLSALLAGATALVKIRRWRAPAYEQMLQELGRIGIRVEPSSSAAEILSRTRSLRPELTAQVEKLVRLHELERFSPRAISVEERRAARAALRELFARS